MSHPRDEELLERFRRWLEQARADSDELAAQDGDLALRTAPAEGVGLYRLVEEFTALRQEVKLQVRSARGLDEQTENLLGSLRQALDALRAIEPKEAQAAWSAGKGLALALAELDEALDRGKEQLERFGARMADDSRQSLVKELDEVYAAQSWLKRRLSRGYHERVRGAMEKEAAARSQQRALFEALIDGYALIQQRLARALASQGIARIAVLGQPVDPEQMVVLEVVDGVTRNTPAGVVAEEVRRGYTWNGRLLRYAEVRATRMRVGVGGPRCL